MLNIDSSASLAKVIDHSILRPNFTELEVEKEIRIALKWNVASVCVMPCYLPLVVNMLRGTSIYPCTVSGFPLGYIGQINKIFGVRNSIHSGAKEIDHVINISKVVSEKWNEVEHEVQTVTNECHSKNAKIKIIFENCYLTDAQKVKLTRICCRNDVDWIKTSTGFGPSGAKLFDVELMMSHVSGSTQVKAAGGIKTFEDMLAYVKAGCTRCGCSSTDEVLTKAREFYGC